MKFFRGFDFMLKKLSRGIHSLLSILMMFTIISNTAMNVNADSGDLDLFKTGDFGTDGKVEITYLDAFFEMEFLHDVGDAILFGGRMGIGVDTNGDGIADSSFEWPYVALLDKVSETIVAETDFDVSGNGSFPNVMKDGFDIIALGHAAGAYAVDAIKVGNDYLIAVVVHNSSGTEVRSYVKLLDGNLQPIAETPTKNTEFVVSGLTNSEGTSIRTLFETKDGEVLIGGVSSLVVNGTTAKRGVIWSVPFDTNNIYAPLLGFSSSGTVSDYQLTSITQSPLNDQILMGISNPNFDSSAKIADFADIDTSNPNVDSIRNTKSITNGDGTHLNDVKFTSDGNVLVGTIVLDSLAASGQGSGFPKMTLYSDDLASELWSVELPQYTNTDYRVRYGYNFEHDETHQVLLLSGGYLSIFKVDVNGGNVDGPEVDMTLVDPSDGSILGSYHLEYDASTAPENENGIYLHFSNTREGYLLYASLVHVTTGKSGQCNTIITFYIREVKDNKPKIRTSAYEGGKAESDKTIVAGTSVTITDKVTYENLTVGVEYTLTGTLMDKGTGQPLLIGGNPVTATKKFTPSTADGTTTLDFTFNASALGGKTLVVFEVLTNSSGTEIAKHEDLTDVGQTIEITSAPRIRTNAYEGGVIVIDPTDKSIIAGNPVTITDTVTYTNLTVGTSYTLTGTLMDKGTGLPLLIGGNPVKVIKSFTPTNANGTEDLDFTFDASGLGGSTLVVYEVLTDNSSTVIARHEDINDLAQTIELTTIPRLTGMPFIRTNAYEGGSVTTDKSIVAGVNVTVTDMVTYGNLTAGQTYTLKGTLMDKATGQPLLINGSPVTTTKSFTPLLSDGIVTISFTFDASALGGKTLVVFEVLTDVSGIVIADHEDITDVAQTVSVVPKPTIPTIPKTGVTDINYFYSMLIVAGVLLIGMMAYKKKEN